jgi:hypothetical protein
VPPAGGVVGARGAGRRQALADDRLQRRAVRRTADAAPVQREVDERLDQRVAVADEVIGSKRLPEEALDRAVERHAQIQRGELQLEAAQFVGDVGQDLELRRQPRQRRVRRVVKARAGERDEPVRLRREPGLQPLHERRLAGAVDAHDGCTPRHRAKRSGTEGS